MTSSTVSKTALIVLLLAALWVPAAGTQQPPAPAAAPSVEPPADAIKTDSGLAMAVLVPGSGTVKPGPSDVVKLRFVGYKKDGSSFSSPANYQTQIGAIALPGLAEGLKLMVAGEKRRLWMPEKLAFKGAAGRPAGPLVFDVELLGFAELPKTPADVAAPPASADKAKSGLVSAVLKPGTGGAHPSRTSKVTVHYSGWTTDGKLFDSSVARGTPATFPLDQVIAGWTEGLQLMVTGESRRFWIPEKLAYQGAEGKPKGMLVFDVDLIAIDGKQ